MVIQMGTYLCENSISCIDTSATYTFLCMPAVPIKQNETKEEGENFIRLERDSQSTCVLR